MKRVILLFVLYALSAGQILRVPSSYENGVKWEFGTNVFHGDVLARSNVGQVPAVPTVYKKELVAPIARREPVVAAVYKKPSVVPDVYKKLIVPTVYKKEPVMPNIRKQQSVIPSVVKVHSVHSNIYKSEPVVQNIYKQQAAVPIVHKMHPTVSNVYQFKSQPIHPLVHHQEPPPLLQDLVPRILPVISRNKMQYNGWNYQYDPHYAHVHEDVHVIPHN